MSAVPEQHSAMRQGGRLVRTVDSVTVISARSKARQE